MHKLRLFAGLCLLSPLGWGQQDWIRQIRNKPFVDVREYQFTRINGEGAEGDLSSPGTGKVITFSSCPLTTFVPAEQYVRISGGTGTAEAAIVSATTCTPNAPGGTITVTTANAHTEDWAVTSATAGITEAVISNPLGALIYIPEGEYTLYQKVLVSGGEINIRGSGGPTKLIWSGPDGVAMFDFDGGANRGNNGIGDFLVTGPNNQASATTIRADQQVFFSVSNVFIDGMAKGLEFITLNQGVIRNINMQNLAESTGTGMTFSGGNIASLVEGFIISTSTNPLAGIIVTECGDITLRDMNIIHSGVGLLVNPGNGQTVASLEIRDSYFDNSQQQGVLIAPTGTGAVVRSGFIGSWASSGLLSGISVVSGASTTINDLSFDQMKVKFNGLHGIYLSGVGLMRGVRIQNSAIGSNSVTSPGRNGIQIEAPTDGLLIQNNFSGNITGEPATQSTGIAFGVTTSNSLTITGNVLPGNTFAPLFTEDLTATSFIVNNNNPVVIPTIASAASITVDPTYNTLTISGTTPIDTLVGGSSGKQLTLIFTNAAPGGVTTGGNIARAQSAAQNQAITLTFDGTNWY